MSKNKWGPSKGWHCAKIFYNTHIVTKIIIHYKWTSVGIEYFSSLDHQLFH